MFYNAVIETGRLLIRPQCLEDTEELYLVANEENFHQYIPESLPDRNGVVNS